MSNEKIAMIPAVTGPQSPAHQEIYTNTSKVGLSPWDIRLVFGHIIEKNGTQMLEDLVTVVTSPQHAKVLVSAWAKAVQSYEENFGAIPDLTDKVTQMQASVAKAN
jgi:hypothetical protein